jgi:hypothetical protein
MTLQLSGTRTAAKIEILQVGSDWKTRIRRRLPTDRAAKAPALNEQANRWECSVDCPLSINVRHGSKADNTNPRREGAIPTALDQRCVPAHHGNDLPGFAETVACDGSLKAAYNLTAGSAMDTYLQVCDRS